MFYLSVIKKIPRQTCLFFATMGVAATIMTTTAAHAAPDGLKILPSPHSVSDTIDKLQAVLESKGMKIFARIDHAAGAESAGMELRPTQLLIFGNPKVGTPLMKCAQTIGIDLPQKMLAWQDADGKVFLGYDDPAQVKSRHSAEGCDEVFAKVTGALSNFAAAATSP